MNWLWSKKPPEPPPIKPEALGSLTATLTTAAGNLGEDWRPTSMQAAAAWFAIPSATSLRLLGYTEPPEAGVLQELSACVGVVAAKALLGTDTSTSSYEDVQGALQDHVKLFIVYWLGRFARVKPGRIYKQIRVLTAMMAAVLEANDGELAAHFGLEQAEDRQKFAESLAHLVRHTSISMPYLRSNLAD